jgi:nucleoside-diphosphate-sugar epimerase
MNIEGRNILVLGGAGMVGIAVCRRLMRHNPEKLIVAARREARSRRATEQLSAEFSDTQTTFLPVWGDVFLRVEWQMAEGDTRPAVLRDPEKRRRLIRDTLDPLDEEIVGSSFLVRLVTGAHPALEGRPVDAIIDCMNTATAVSYQNVYEAASSLAALAASDKDGADWREDAERLIAALYVPQLVRHMQLLYEAMRRAGCQGYVKVGTSGTGGMGFNIPFTHGEEKPSRLLLSKAATAGAQTALTFLMARTPDGPPTVKEIKPTAMIGWRAICHGPIARRGQGYPLYDCPPSAAVPVTNEASLAPEGDFGTLTGETLEAVYIDTGENGLFAAAEFAAITAPGMMQIVTPEEVAENAVRELQGGNTGHDVVGALDASATESSFRGGYLRQAALNRLEQLEAEHGEAVAFEILGPPRLSKLLYEAWLLKDVFRTGDVVLAAKPEALATALEAKVSGDPELRSRIISIGIPILLPDGARLLRGPVIKAADADSGWVDLTPANMGRWQERLEAILAEVQAGLAGDTSSLNDRGFRPAREWRSARDIPDIGEIAAWIMDREGGGRRAKG